MAHCAFQFGRIVCMVEEEEEEEFDIAEHRIVKPYQFELIIGQPVSSSEYSASEDEESGEQNSEEEGESDLSDSEPETTGEETEFDGDVDLDGAENQDGPTTPPRRKRKRSDQSHRIGNTNWYEIQCIIPTLFRLSLQAWDGVLCFYVDDHLSVSL